MSYRVGILTSGGDCQSLNATMRGFAKALYNIEPNCQIIGFEKGYYGLMYNISREMKPGDFSGLLVRGGTILGTSRQPFKKLDDPDENNNNKVELMKATYMVNKLDCLVVLGGNGSLKTANRLSEEDLNVIGLPKTIDNDIYGTELTFGFHSALDIATHTIDLIHSTAASHSRVFLVEIMGHKVGWLTLYAGLAAGADIILIPEIPYDIKSIKENIIQRRGRDNKFTIIAVAEGAKSKEEAEMSKKTFKQHRAGSNDLSISYRIANEISEVLPDAEVRVTVPGHMQRGGQPSAYDRFLASMIGSEGARLAVAKDYGRMVAYVDSKLTSIPLSETAGKLKYVDPESLIVKQARQLGIGFGD